MKKNHRAQSEQSGSIGINSNAEARSRTEQISNARGAKWWDVSAGMYEEGDLRGIVAEAIAKSTDPYYAFLEFGIIKNAAEFFNNLD